MFSRSPHSILSVPQDPPLEVRWDSVRFPLPLREVRPHERVTLPAHAEAPPWIDTGKQDEPFHFSARLHDLCDDIRARCETFQHLDVSRILFSFTQARSPRSHGLQARVTPLRFRGGSLVRMHRGVNYQVQRFVRDGQDILYIITFCLPRFLNRTFEDKFITIFHELYHISPEFDGDLRRHEGRYSIHSASQKRYDEQMAELAREYLHNGADTPRHAFLRLNFAQLRQRHGRILAHAVPRPKVIPLRYLPRRH